MPERYDPAKAPRLYQPARINNVNVALRSGDRRDAAERLRRHVRARHRRPLQRHGAAAPTRTTRKGFRDNQGIEPEPRVGLAWDITGDSQDGAARERRAVPQPARQRERPRRDGAEPAGAEHAEHHLRRRWTRCSPPARRARSRTGRAPSSASSATRRRRRATTTRSASSAKSGWGTVLDVTYAGFQMRNAEMATSINSVPDGARFVDVNPQNANPQNPTTAEAERVPASVPRLPGHHDPRALRHARRTTRCRCSSIAATSTGCSSRSPTPRQDRQRRHERDPPGTTRCGPADSGTRGRTARRSCTTWSSTTRGTCRTAAGCGTTS